MGETGEKTRLKLFNSLTRSKELFEPLEPNFVKWYSCGPTVYDAAHLGHARCYMCFDILRRVLEQYFHYNVYYVMNITDIDDKIIRKARQEHFLETKSEEFPRDPAFTDDQYLNELDKEFKGKVPVDNEVFRRFALKWEEKFHDDMRRLNIQKPDDLTRVSDFIEEIIAFIEKIVENGFGYVSERNSVYFDVTKFNEHKEHKYAKLMPEAFGNIESLNEGEGVLADGTDKRNAVDFALWKASKIGEPAWDSPWGRGRPGWHIECSVMASHLCGHRIDIHSGGIDLKFPHHDNELAQSEAHFQSDQWIRYFVHSGHLTISGCKMSKSLKNFITIEEALKTYSARQIRLNFLLHNWLQTLDFSADTLEVAIQYEKFLNEFFLNVKDILRQYDVQKKPNKRWLQKDKDLLAAFVQTKTKIHEALCDNIDTKSVLCYIKELIHTCNNHMSGVDANRELLKNIAEHVSYVCTVFGLNETGDQQFGFTSKNASELDYESVAYPIVKTLCDFRERIRTVARACKNVDILKECDKIRNETLPKLGIRIEDKEGHTTIKFVDPGPTEIEEKTKIKPKITHKKDSDPVAVVAPELFFRSMTDQYSQFDENNMPTHDQLGNPLTKTALKKVHKLYNLQKTKYEKYQSNLNGTK